MPGYHTGPACHLGYLTGARHSHLDSAGYSLDQKAAAKGEALTPDGVATALLAGCRRGSQAPRGRYAYHGHKALNYGLSDRLLDSGVSGDEVAEAWFADVGADCSAGER